MAAGVDVGVVDGLLGSVSGGCWWWCGRVFAFVCACGSVLVWFCALCLVLLLVLFLLCPCARHLLVVGVLVWGLVRVFVIGARGLVLARGVLCLVVACLWAFVGGGCGGVCVFWFLVLARGGWCWLAWLVWWCW